MLDEFVYIYLFFWYYYVELGICCYGFYGISYKYVSGVLVEKLGVLFSVLWVICCYFGNGSSVCVIKNGCLVNMLMGFML